MKKWIRSIGFVVLGTMVWLAGCESDTGTSALIGGAVGAGAGQLIGGDTKSTVIGGAIGAGAGYAYEEWIKDDNGNGELNGDREVLDEDVAEPVEEAPPPRYDEDYGVNAENTVVVDVTNTDGSTTPVRLVRQGDVWVGPRGEQYQTFPTQEQLRVRYGY